MESCNWSDRRKAIEELLRGREMANKLKALLITNDSLRGDGDGDGSVSLDQLLTHILTSFSNTLCILNTKSNAVVSESDEVSFPATAPCRKSEDSGDSSKCTPPVCKDGRSCYKRRKTPESWIKESPNLEDDGHAWRKYGQKVILNAKHPRKLKTNQPLCDRNYFRCTHKYDLSCQATKQVQRLDEEPCLYRTTYYGQHTCNCENPLKPSLLILDDPTDNIDSSKLLSFNTNNNHSLTITEQPTPFSKSSDRPVVSIKQVHRENVPSNIYYEMPHHQSSTFVSDHDNYRLFPSGHDDAFDHVISGTNSSSCITTSTHGFGFDMDHVIGRVEFSGDDVFKFDF